jgi:hypothetical protein
MKLSAALETKIRELHSIVVVWAVHSNWVFDCIASGQLLGPDAYEPTESGKQARELWQLGTSATFKDPPTTR